MGKHSRSSRRAKLGTLATTGIAFEVAGVLAAAYAMNPTISDVGLAANHTIFVDGTKSALLTDVEDPPDRMRDSFDGRYDFAGDSPEFVQYPGTLGIASILSDGLGAPTFDASEQVAVDDLVARVRADQTSANPSDKLYIVGYSQGGSAAVRAVNELENSDDFVYDADKVVVIIAANPRRNDGGLLTRFPAFTLPLVGATFGGGTDPSQTRIIQVTKQYDGVADAPVYVLNVLADANAILGYVYLHSGYYQEVEIDPENPPADALVTTHSGGRVTDVLLRNQPGDLPLTRPLLSLGVPREIVVALDPILRAIIETGYDRPANGAVVSDQPVGFKLLPGPDQLLQDSQAVLAGAVQTAEALGSPVGSASSAQSNPTAARLQQQQVDAATEGTSEKAEPSTETAPLEFERVTESTKPTPRQAPQGKFSPVRAPSGGWKPGALLRSLRDAVQPTAARKPSEPSAPSVPDTPEKVADSPADDATPSSEG